LDNYFNYFTEIEEHFCKRRGTLMTVSPIDWALMEIWKDAGISLEAVFRGIDATFDKWDRRARKTRKVNGLGFCAQEVLAAAEGLKDAAVGSPVAKQAAPGLEHAAVAGFLRANAGQLEQSTLPGTVAVIARESASTLLNLASEVERGSVPMEDLERRLTVIEEKLIAALVAATPDEALYQVRREADRDLAPYRSKMTAPQIAQLQKQYVQKRLLEQYQVPRLSLFYM